MRWNDHDTFQVETELDSAIHQGQPLLFLEPMFREHPSEFGKGLYSLMIQKKAIVYRCRSLHVDNSLFYKYIKRLLFVDFTDAWNRIDESQHAC